MVAPGKRPCPVPDYHVEMLDGELLLFHPAGQTIMHANDTAVLVWNLCDGQRTAAEIVQILSTAYPEAAAVIEPDVSDLLEQLASNGAIIWQ